MCGPPDYREVQLESRFEGSGFEVCERESDQPREFPRPALRMSTRASPPPPALYFRRFGCPIPSPLCVLLGYGGTGLSVLRNVRR